MRFTHVDFGEVRSVMVGTTPWFVGIDIARALGYKNPSVAINERVLGDFKKMLKIIGRVEIRESRTSTSKLETDDSSVSSLSTNYQHGGVRRLMFINEAGVYQLIFGSKLESAIKFQRWIAEEVLPSIRKYGGYIDGSHSDIRELTKISFNALNSAMSFLISYGGRNYTVDEEKSVKL